jgi:predicted nucleic acid-binding protein
MVSSYCLNAEMAFRYRPKKRAGQFLPTNLSHTPALAEQVQNDPNSFVVPQTSIQFRNAFRLYQQRQDKGWSLTHCASILTMQAEGINEALAHDIHFRQAGFTVLLRDD